MRPSGAGRFDPNLEDKIHHSAPCILRYEATHGHPKTFVLRHEESELLEHESILTWIVIAGVAGWLAGLIVEGTASACRAISRSAFSGLPLPD